MSSDSLQGRIYEFCLADLQKDEDQAFRKIKLKCEDISGRNCLTNFFAMDFTRDKLCSLVRSTASGGWAAGSVRWGGWMLGRRGGIAGALRLTARGGIRRCRLRCALHRWTVDRS